MIVPLLEFLLKPEIRAKSGRLFDGLLWALVSLGILASLSGLAAAERLSPPQVLILNSYHPGLAWSDNEMAGVLQELRKAYPKIDPAIEYLDDKRFPTADHLLFMKDYLAKKYRGRKFDLVMTLDNAALELALQYRAQLFPGTPIVFAGLNSFKPEMLAGQKQVTGAAEMLDIAGTLSTALALHPGTSQIYVLSDYTISGKAGRKLMEAILPSLPPGIQVDFAPLATIDEITQQIKALPSSAMILITSFFTDKAGQTFSIAESVRHIVESAKVPVYILHESRLGYGPVGGMLLGGTEEGRRAGEIALRVLAGEDPARIPVDTKSTARPMFDYQQLARFNLPLRALPPGSIIINRPSSFYEVHKSLVWGASGVILALGLLIMGLVVNITRRRQAETKLQHQLGFLQNLLDTIPNPVFFKDAQGVYLGCNKALEEFLGLPHAGIVGKTVFDIYPKDLADKYYAMDEELFQHPGTQIYEFDMEKGDGARRKYIFTKATFLAPDGSLGGLIGVMTDITERKRVEEELAAAAQKWRTTFDAISDAVFLMDRDGRILQYNQALADLVGKPFEDVRGRHCHTVIHGTSQHIEGCPLVRMWESRQREEMLLKQGDRWYKVGVDPILDEAGNLTGAVHIMSDVTQLTETERSLSRRSQELMVLNTIGSVVSRSLDLNEILEDALWMIQENIFEGQSRVIVFLLDEATRKLRAVSHRGVPADHPCLGTPVDLEECLCGQAALKGAIVFTREGCKDNMSSSQSPDFVPHHDICLPLKGLNNFLGVLHLSIALDHEVDERHLKLLEAIAAQISVAAEKARLFEQVRLQRTQLRNLSARLAEMEETERKVLARELHDQVGQSLTTLSLYLSMLQEELPEEMPESISNRLTEALALVEGTGDSVREIMAELRPPVLDDFGLLAAARWVGKQFYRSTGIHLEATGEEPAPRLDRKVEVGLFRIVQEALNNVAKHSKASRVQVTEEVYDDRIRLTIADNGVGFDPSMAGQPEGRHRWGLMTMSERALAAGGTCRIESRPGQGTRVIVEVNR